MKDLFGHDKVDEAIERIKMFEPPEGYYLADSGGKDSSVLLALTKMANIKFDAHYSVTTIDPPELIYFLRKYHPETMWERPEIPLLIKLIEKGFPTSQNRWCCEHYKERGGSGRKVLTGIRSQESNKRAGRKMVEQCFRDSSKTYINPIIDWTENDIWNFIKSQNLPYCSLYDEGFRRIGCVLCPKASKLNRLREAQRWPKMTNNFLKSFIKLYEGKKDRESFQRWKSGEEMFNWWLYQDQPKNNPDQTVLFE